MLVRLKLRKAALLGLALGIVTGAACLLTGSCSLGNVEVDLCTTDLECATTFGTGSKCTDGYCTEPSDPGCSKLGSDGRECYTCPPKTVSQFQNACTGATCLPFDNAKRLTKLGADGGLPPLP